MAWSFICMAVCCNSSLAIKVAIQQMLQQILSPCFSLWYPSVSLLEDLIFCKLQTNTIQGVRHLPYKLRMGFLRSWIKPSSNGWISLCRITQTYFNYRIYYFTITREAGRTLTEWRAHSSLSCRERTVCFSTHAIDKRTSAEISLCKYTCIILKALVITQSQRKRTYHSHRKDPKAKKTSMMTIKRVDKEG